MHDQDFSRVLDEHSRSIQELRLSDERIKGRVDTIEDRLGKLDDQLREFRVETKDANASTQRMIDEIRMNQAKATGSALNTEKWLKLGVPLAALLVTTIEFFLRYS